VHALEHRVEKRGTHGQDQHTGESRDVYLSAHPRGPNSLSVILFRLLAVVIATKATSETSVTVYIRFRDEKRGQ
jgi:hypothetical protein